LRVAGAALRHARIASKGSGAPMMDFVEMVMRPQLFVMVFASIAAFATVLTIAMPILNKDQVNKRVRVMATERDKMRLARMSELKTKDSAAGTGRLRQSSGGIVQQIIDQFDLRSKFETDELRNKLRMAGLRSPSHLYMYVAFRMIMPVVMTIFGMLYVFVINPGLQYPPMVKVMMGLGAGFLGFYLPNVFIENIVQKRQQAIKAAFPDSLDMMLICVQSGMSIEASFGRVSREVASQSIELAEELSLTTAELSYLQDRKLAFENFGKRTGLPGIKAVATALMQAERYGTPIGTALRVMAKENRDLRMLEAEKKAASLPPKLTVPMIIFFLPVLFVVILGPAAIQIMKWD
jgi:tight adherence protein C